MGDRLSGVGDKAWVTSVGPHCLALEVAERVLNGATHRDMVAEVGPPMEVDDVVACLTHALRESRAPEVVSEGTAEDLIHDLTEPEKDQILRDVVWEFFGDVDDAGANTIRLGRSPEPEEVEAVRRKLRFEVFGVS